MKCCLRMLNALTEAVAVVQRPTRAAHEADSQRATSDYCRSRRVPLSLQVSALSLQVSALSLQVPVLRSLFLRPSALQSPISSLSPPPSSLKSQPSVLISQVSALSPPPSGLIHLSFCSKKIEQRIPSPHTKVVFATKPSVSCKRTASFDRLTNGGSLSRMRLAP